MDQEEKSKITDIFYRQSIYPEAEQIFSFRPKSIEEIKEGCIVVLDTNALLVPYGVGKESLDEIRRKYTDIVAQKRLVVPGQVAREFADNRVTKLRDLYQQLSRKRDNRLELGNYPLLQNLDEYQRANDLYKTMNEQIREYSGTIKKILDHVRNWYWNDPVSQLYGELFAKDVVVDLSFDMAEIKTDLERRTQYKIPPGYKDKTKDDGGVGDLIIWHTILEIGKSRKQSVIFVSGEEKADWWHRGEGGTLYPRYELIDEYRRSSGGESFHILSFSKFLELFGASDEVVEEVKNEEVQTFIDTEQRSVTTRHEYLKVEFAVFQWLNKHYPNVEINSSIANVDFAMTNPDGTEIGVEVLYFRQPYSFMNRLRRTAAHLAGEVKEGGFSSIHLILVGSNESIAQELIDCLKRVKLDFYITTIIIGYLASGPEFIPIQFFEQPSLLTST